MVIAWSSSATAAPGCALHCADGGEVDQGRGVARIDLERRLVVARRAGEVAAPAFDLAARHEHGRLVGRQRHGAVEVGHGATEVAELAEGVAAAHQRLDIVGLDHQHLVEVLDGAVVGALAHRQQHAAAEEGERRLRVGLDRRAVVFHRLVGLAAGVERHGAPVERQRIGVAGIDQPVVALHRLDIVLAGQRLVADRRARDAARQSRQCDLVRLELAALQRLGAGGGAALGVGLRRKQARHALGIGLPGCRLVGVGSGGRCRGWSGRSSRSGGCRRGGGGLGRGRTLAGAGAPPRWSTAR